MHSGDLAEIEQASLSKQEKEALLEVMERAKDFDRQMSARGKRGPSLEGQLQKWTNPLKGWQPRWFSVDQLQGVLHYYTSEDKKKQAPRGSLHLWGAVVAPSEEDSQTFTVNGANGEIYKLRAVGPKERQHWVSRLRREVETCTNQPYATVAREGGSVSSNGDGQSSSSPQHSVTTPTRALSKRLSKGWIRPSSSKASNAVNKSGGTSAGGPGDTDGGQEGALNPVKDTSRGLDNFPGGDAMLEVLTRLQRLQEAFSNQLQVCVANGELSATDQKVLMTRATSQAALASVKDCLALMKVQMNSSDQDSALPLKRSPSASPTHISAGNNLSSTGETGRKEGVSRDPSSSQT